jgi:hypothetical protein
LERIFGSTYTDWRDMLRLKARFLGHGAVDPERALFSTDQRVVMLGWDSLGNKQAHNYHVPLPPSLRAQKIKRRAGRPAASGPAARPAAPRRSWPPPAPPPPLLSGGAAEDRT